ncbi:hypothetical protein V1478_005596 [Vespula squamosa]|uniref:Uncharacterized protein n=1 Tax=Vespula squamosa TaxID=30214 RepID=A0ABD2BAG3_VESSQ
MLVLKARLTRRKKTKFINVVTTNIDDSVLQRFNRMAIEGPSDDASGTWIKLKFVLEQVAFGTRIDPIR